MLQPFKAVKKMQKGQECHKGRTQNVRIALCVEDTSSILAYTVVQYDWQFQ